MSLFKIDTVMHVSTHHLFRSMRGGIAKAMRASGLFIPDRNQGEGILIA